MGFDLERIQKVLLRCQTKEEAIDCLVNNVEPSGREREGEEDGSDGFEDEQEDYKMIFVVRMDLKMGLNKIAELTATSCLNAYRRIERESKMNQFAQYALINWTEGQQKKIVVKANSQQDLQEVVKRAKENKINFVEIWEVPSKLVPVKVQKAPAKKQEKMKKKEKG